MVERLAEDHANARRLAEGIAGIAGLATEPARVMTNILYIDLKDRRFSDEEFLRRLAAKGVRLSHTGPARFRMLTHYGITAGEIDAALGALREVMQGCY
jgi:threonine aldolase